MARAREWAEYVGVRFAEWLVGSLSPRVAVKGAGVAGAVWCALDARRRARVRENLRTAFGTDTLPGGGGTRAVFGSMMRVPAEVLLAPRLLGSPRTFARRVRLLGDWPLLRADAERGGGVVVTGHVGNWEVGAWALARVVPRVRVVVRPIENPLVDAHVERTRGRTGRVIGKRGAVHEALGALHEGEWVAILADQDAGRHGTFVPFFGLPASTSSAPAALALRTGVPCYAGACLRRPRGGAFAFDVHLRRLPAPEGGNAADRLHALVAAATEALEGWVRAAPDQYNWLHRRWKTRPAGEPAGGRVPAYARSPGR